jgi:hypothetical protein
MMKKIYKGFLEYKENSEGEQLISFTHVKDEWFEDNYLSSWIEGDIDNHGSYLTVRYYITNKELSEDELNDEWIKTLEGFGDVCYDMRYSDCTGYLWTDNKLNVGGHDLMEELESYIGRFLWLEIEYHKGQ